MRYGPRPIRPTVPLLAVLMVGLSALVCGCSEAAPAPATQGTDSAPSGEPRAVEPGAKVPQAVQAITHHADLHHGLDVSSHSGEVDWVELRKAGHTFAFLKATEGVDLRDPAFETHWPLVKEAGMLRGAYHFFVTEDDPEEQARFFIANAPLVSGDLAPVVDIELLGHNTQPGLAGRLAIFLQRLEEHYGVKPIIYTAPNFWDEHVWSEVAALGDGAPNFGDHPLWVAEYGVKTPRLPKGWTSWHLWQWQGDAAVAGVAQSADLSKVNRDGVDLTPLVIP